MGGKNSVNSADLGTGPERVLHLLKEAGPSDAESLASRLSVTGTAIRQHLYILRDRDLVVARSEPRPMGRPAKIWELTKASESFFPRSGSPMLESLLKSTQNMLGVDGMRTAICGCVEDQVDRYRQRLLGKRSLLAKLKALVEIRNQDGFMAQLERQSDGSFLLYENHCPIAEAVASCAQLCDAELMIFKQLLSDQAEIERVEHMDGGDRRCSYRIVHR